jgi:hypothetical protein
VWRKFKRGGPNGVFDQDSHETRRAGEAVDDSSNLPAGEDDRKPLGAFGPDDVVQPMHLLLEHLAIKEEHSAQRLVLGGRGHVALDGQRT